MRTQVSASAHRNQELLSEFRRDQRAMYAGGPLEAVADRLTEDVVWHVPGRSPIAGDHRGRDAVVAYFRQRRELADNTLRIEIRESLADEVAVVELADGHACLAGEDASWRTVGLYRLEAERIAEAWLVPFDVDHFDLVWSRTRRATHSRTARVRAPECDGGVALGHARLLEHFEAAFAEASGSLGSGRSWTVAALDVRYRAPVHADDLLRIDVAFDRLGDRSLEVHYTATVGDRPAADGRVTYVRSDSDTGEGRGG
jgi:acyl-CoA thioesterase FadM/ketosteroid isomerase-like protein